MTRIKFKGVRQPPNYELLVRLFWLRLRNWEIASSYLLAMTKKLLQHLYTPQFKVLLATAPNRILFIRCLSR